MNGIYESHNLILRVFTSATYVGSEDEDPEYVGSEDEDPEYGGSEDEDPDYQVVNHSDFVNRKPTLALWNNYSLPNPICYTKQMNAKPNWVICEHLLSDKGIKKTQAYQVE